MAASISYVHKTVMGDKRVWYGKYTAENGTDTVASGLKWIDHVQVTPATAANMSACAINTAASGAGDFELTTGTSGGTYHMMFIGV